MSVTRTAINIAPFVQPDRITTLFRYTVEFKGNVPISEAARKAEHIIRASRLDHTERGYLLNCLEIGNFEVAHV